MGRWVQSLPGPGRVEWDALAERSGNVFLTKDFVECWWQAFDAPGDPLILADHHASPKVILPLYVTRGPLRVVRQIGHGLADELGPACAPELHTQAALLLEEALRDGRRWDVLLLHDVPSAHQWSRRLDGRVLWRSPSPVIDLADGDWEAFLAGRSHNFRQQVRRRERRVRDAGGVVRESTMETLEGDLDTLFRLHRLRWGDAASFATGPRAAMVRSYARVALPSGAVRLSILELDGLPVAAHLGLRHGLVYSFWQSGRNPAFENLSVGTVLLLDAVRTALTRGAHEFRLLRGGEEYKWRLATADRPLETVARTSGLVGRVALGVSGVRRRHRARRAPAQATSGAATP